MARISLRHRSFASSTLRKAGSQKVCNSTPLYLRGRCLLLTASVSCSKDRSEVDRCKKARTSHPCQGVALMAQQHFADNASATFNAPLN